MNYATLLSVFPAGIVAALTGVASGVITTSEVYYSREATRPFTSAGLAVWLHGDPDQPELAEEIGGGYLVRYRFQALLHSEGAIDETILRAYVNAMRAYFHGKLPSTFSTVTDLLGFTIPETIHDVHPGQGGAMASLVVLDAIGREFP